MYRTRRFSTDFRNVLHYTSAYIFFVATLSSGLKLKKVIFLKKNPFGMVYSDSFDIESLAKMGQVRRVSNSFTFSTKFQFIGG